MTVLLFLLHRHISRIHSTEVTFGENFQILLERSGSRHCAYLCVRTFRCHQHSLIQVAHCSIATLKASKLLCVELICDSSKIDLSKTICHNNGTIFLVHLLISKGLIVSPTSASSFHVFFGCLNLCRSYRIKGIYTYTLWAVLSASSSQIQI